MKKLLFLIPASLLVANVALATITTSAQPVSLITSPLTARASSGPIGLFLITLKQDAGETLASVTVNIANTGSSTAIGSHLASVSVYKDNGDGVFNSATDILAGTQTTVNIGSDTTITTNTNNAIATTDTKFFVSLTTSGTWTDQTPADSIAVTLPTNGITTSANSPTVTTITTNTITADTTAPIITIASYTTTPVNTDIIVNATTNEGTINYATHTFTSNGSFDFIATDAAGNSTTKTVTITNIDKLTPTLTAAVARNTGGTNNKEAGDTIVLTFSQETNKPTIDAGSISNILILNNSHSFLDGAGTLGLVTWSTDGKVLTVNLSANTSLPTVAIGDTVTISGSVIKDLAGNTAGGTQTITGSFSGQWTGDGDDNYYYNNKKECSNDLLNGRLYRIGSGDTVYLAAGCTLKTFKGAAVGKAEGKKFKNIITLDTMPLPGTNAQSDNSPKDNKKVERIQNVDNHNVERNLELEKKALKTYNKLFRHLPKNSSDWKVLNFIAYGGEISDRDIVAEVRAMRTFVSIYKHLPKTTEDWTALHALAYGSNL